MSSQQRVLIVDDEEAIVRLVATWLDAAGYAVVTAPNGAEGLKRFRENPGFDLVIADVLMPELKGTDMVRAIHRQAPDLRVLFITGYADETVHNSVEELPFEVIRKPFSPQHLLARVRDTLR